MTKKHYVAIAQIVSDGALINCETQATLVMNRATCAKIARQMATYFFYEDPRFDRARFLAACGLWRVKPRTPYPCIPVRDSGSSIAV